MWSFADKGRPSEIGNFLRYSIFYDEPAIAARDDCFLTAVSEGHDRDGGGGVNVVFTEDQLKVVVALIVSFFRFHQPIHIIKNYQRSWTTLQISWRFLWNLFVLRLQEQIVGQWLLKMISHQVNRVESLFQVSNWNRPPWKDSFRLLPPHQKDYHSEIEAKDCEGWLEVKLDVVLRFLRRRDNFLVDIFFTSIAHKKHL